MRSKRRTEITVRSSAAEYLTFIASTGSQEQSVEMRYEDENILLTQKLGQLERMVSAYLDLAEIQAMLNIPMTMQDWETRLNRFLEATDHNVLQDPGKVTAGIARQHAETEFEKYRIVQDRLFQSDFDRFVELEEAAVKKSEGG